MLAVSKILKNGREHKLLSLQDAAEKAHIDITQLSRIENGKRLPTPEQIAVLSEIYELEPRMLMVQRESDRIVSGIENPEIALETIKTAEEKIMHGDTYLDVHKDEIFPEAIKLESRRYIGSKAKLTDWIYDIVKDEITSAQSFCDIFAGTASVTKRFINEFDTIIINDFLFSNNVIYNAFFGPGEWSKDIVMSYIKRYNALNPAELDDNYFSLNFGGKFYEYQVSKLIGEIRQDIEDHKQELTPKEYNILLATLIYNIDKLANTVGHFDAYIKKDIKPQKLVLKMIEAQSYSHVQIYREDANELARKINADIVYIDPPYNSRQYCRFYHLYETLIKWDKPQLFGTALKPAPENMSKYCTTKAVDAFRDLIQHLDAKYIVVSYNNTYNSKSSSSENKITLEEIQSILECKGRTKVFDKSYRYFNAGKTELDDHKELIFVTKVNG